VRPRGSALALVVCLAAYLGLPQGPSGAATHSEKQAGFVYFRPVLCYAPAHDAARHRSESLTTSSCSPSSRLSAQNLGVTPNGSVAGYSVQTVPPDMALAAVPSTSAAKDRPSSVVLLPGLPVGAHASASLIRYLLGPAEMTGTAIAHASVSKDQAGQWVVDYSMTKKGAALFDKVWRENFHKFLAIDVDGVVVSAPLLQPGQSTFASFDGSGEVSGNLSQAEATKLARAMEPHHR
jgi:hypothetical protein